MCSDKTCKITLESESSITSMVNIFSSSGENFQLINVDANSGDCTQSSTSFLTVQTFICNKIQVSIFQESKI